VASEDLTRAVDEVGAAYELLPHAHTESALAEAQALGLEPADVAKTLSVKTLEGVGCALQAKPSLRTPHGGAGRTA
jgi:hypothetical protein